MSDWVEPSLFDDGEESGATPPPPASARGLDPPTSTAAGERADLSFQRHRYETLWLYLGYGQTDDSAAERSAMLPGGEWHLGTTAKRRKRLQDRGYIEPATDSVGVIELPTRHGVKATVWRLTPAGRALYDAWRQEHDT